MVTVCDNHEVYCDINDDKIINRKHSLREISISIYNNAVYYTRYPSTSIFVMGRSYNRRLSVTAMTFNDSCTIIMKTADWDQFRAIKITSAMISNSSH